MNLTMKRRSLSYAVALALILATMPVPLAQETAAAGSSELSGRILSYPDGAEVAGATLLAYHLSTEQLFTSDPTSGGGQYSLTGMPYGYFDLAVETAEGIFVADQVVNIAPSATSVLTLTLVPFGAGAQGSVADRRSFPGTEDDPIGVARVEEKLRGADFWSSKKGVALLAGGGGVLLLFLAGGGSSGSRSPSSP
jgi:hypothetical protein